MPHVSAVSSSSLKCSAAVCVIGLQLLCVALFKRFDLRENFQNMTNSLKSILVVPSQIDSLKSLLSLK